MSGMALAGSQGNCRFAAKWRKKPVKVLNLLFDFLWGWFMIFPLEQLVKFKGNVYEITSAASRRAFQLAMVPDSTVEDNDGKVVSLAARQLFTNEVQYRIETPRQ